MSIPSSVTSIGNVRTAAPVTRAPKHMHMRERVAAARARVWLTRRRMGSSAACVQYAFLRCSGLTSVSISSECKLGQVSARHAYTHTCEWEVQRAHPTARYTARLSAACAHGAFPNTTKIKRVKRK